MSYSHEYEFDHDIWTKDGKVYHIEGCLPFDIDNDSFDYDYGSISATHVLPDYISDYDLDGIEVTTYDDDDNIISVPTKEIEGIIEDFINIEHRDEILESLSEY